MKQLTVRQCAVEHRSWYEGLPAVCRHVTSADDGDAADVTFIQPEGCDLERIRGN
jgi:hypothetical protein